MAQEAGPQTSSGAPPAELLGALLGNYRVLSRLGAGGMGEVYVGRHEALGHKVAIKVLRSEMTRHAEMVKRFFNEAQAATAIRNPGIVQIFDFGTTADGSTYFVMELLDGVSLSDRLQERLLDPVESCRLARQIANVLQAAHDAGITHRDLKPDNLFLVPDSEVIGGERVKVFDFGIAKLAGEIHASGVQTRADLVMGTPSYMSPEQCRGAGSVDTRSDIYSLGCVLFKMVCGRAPFVGNGPGDILASHLHRPPPDLREFAPDVPPALAVLVGKMLEKKREARPQTMSAVSQALEEILYDLVGPPARLSMAMPPIAAGSRGSVVMPLPVTPMSAVHAVPAGAPVPAVPSQSATIPVPPPVMAPGAEVGPPTWREAAPPTWREATPVPGWTPGPMPATPSAPSAPTTPTTSGATTLSGAAGASSVGVRTGGRDRRFPFLLGGFVLIVGAVTAIVVMLAMGDPPSEQQVASTQSEAPPQATAAATSPAAGAATAPAPNATTAAGTTATTAAGTAATGTAATAATADTTAATVDTGTGQTAAPPAPDDLESECRGYQVDKKWAELRKCADALMPTAPQRAAEFKHRAEEEARTAPRVAAAEAALREKSLRRARAELEQVWPESVELAKLKVKYAATENQMITELAASLEQAKSATCAEYEALLAKERAIQPTRVITEATRRATCTPAPQPQQCDADSLVQKAKDEWAKRRYAVSLNTYEAAIQCRPDPTIVRKAFGLACEAHAVAKAKAFWKRLPAVSRAEAKVSCIRDGITEQELNGP